MDICGEERENENPAVSSSPLSGISRARAHPSPAAYTVKKRLAVFPSPAGMSLTKLSLGENTIIIPGQGEFGK
jgi:hypothetical protein